jgi:glycosyltransferase involved in cell wall biosynthesis
MIMNISAVIPTYNRGYIIREAINSVLAQTHPASEILVIDDGSTDNTAEIVESFADREVRYFRHELNRGYSAACNTGLSRASGTFIAFLDSDDIWKPSYLERQSDFLSRNPHVDAVFTDTEIEDANRHIPSLVGLMKAFPDLLAQQKKEAEYIFTTREMYLCLLVEIPIKPSALVFKRDLYVRYGGFDETWPSGTDWDMLLRFSRHTQFGYLNEVLVTQGRTPDATHQIFREQDQLFLLEVFHREKNILLDDRAALSVLNRGVYQLYKNLGYHYAHSGQRTKAIGIYLKGFRETGRLGLALRAVYSGLPNWIRKSGPG